MIKFKRAAAVFTAVLVVLNSVVICYASGYNTINVTSQTQSRMSFSSAAFTRYYGTYTKSGKTYSQRAYSVSAKPDSFMSVAVTDGGSVYGKSTLSNKINSFSAGAGTRTIAAINADFFATSTGIPLGVQISNGVVQTTNSYDYEMSVGRYSLAFKADGSAFVGVPKLEVSVSVGGVQITADRLNSYPDTNLTLVTDDYADKTYWNTGFAHDVIVLEASGDMRIDNAVSCKFESYIKSVTQPVGIERNHLYLIAPAGDGRLSAFEGKNAGTAATALVRDLVGGWAQVTQAVGGGNLLINGGVLRYPSTYDQSISNVMTSRSAIGIKPDGSIVLYAVERDKNVALSGGVPVEAVAQALYNMGCSYAVNFDGGGSTMIAASEYAGPCVVKNSCQDGYERQVSNAIMLVCSEQAPVVVEDFDAGPAVKEQYSGMSLIDVTQSKDIVYTGKGSIKTEYRFAGDSPIVGFNFQNAYNTSSYSHMTVSVYGDGSGESLYAVLYNNAGEYKQNIGKIDFTGWRKLEFNVWGASALRGFALTVPGKTVKSGMIYIDRLVGYKGFTLTDDTAPSITVSQNESSLFLSAHDGAFMSGEDNASFTCTVDGVLLPVVNKTVDISQITGNRIKQAVIEVTDIFGNRAQKIALFKPSGYDAAMPYADVNDSSWDSMYIRYCTEKSIINGFKEDGLRTFRGKDSITRVQYCVMLVRSRGISINRYAGTALPYEDSSEIPSWAMLYVKAAYATGIMTGSKTNTGVSFFASNLITRQEAACAIDKMGVSDDRLAMNSIYSDSGEISGWARASVVKMSACGIFNGDSNGRFYPNRQLSRSESAAVMTRIS